MVCKMCLIVYLCSIEWYYMWIRNIINYCILGTSIPRISSSGHWLNTLWAMGRKPMVLQLSVEQKLKITQDSLVSEKTNWWNQNTGILVFALLVSTHYSLKCSNYDNKERLYYVFYVHTFPIIHNNNVILI